MIERRTREKWGDGWWRSFFFGSSSGMGHVRTHVIGPMPNACVIVLGDPGSATLR